MSLKPYHIELPRQDARLLGEVAELWNENAVGRHAFYPWTAERLAELLSKDGGGRVGRFVTARGSGGELAGFLHFDRVREDGYPDPGVIEALMVDASWRGWGIGSEMLEAALSYFRGLSPAPGFVDALGAWPFGYGFNTLADGSERSGIFLSEPGMYRLFRRAGFVPVRPSLVMRAELGGVVGRKVPDGYMFAIGKRTDRTWLDRVFRGRELWDHELVRGDGMVMSRAIFGLMEGESRYEGRVIFSLFGVNTPADQQGRGYAGMNISHLMEHVRGLGGEVMELHVYGDNDPALALYKGAGFQQVGETVMMHRRLWWGEIT